MQQTELTQAERAEALARPFKSIASIFAAAYAAAERDRDYTDDHSYDEADRKMLRDAERAEWRG